jgi:hypothetical protein
MKLETITRLQDSDQIRLRPRSLFCPFIRLLDTDCSVRTDTSAHSPLHTAHGVLRRCETTGVQVPPPYNGNRPPGFHNTMVKIVPGCSLLNLELIHARFMARIVSAICRLGLEWR